MVWTTSRKVINYTNDSNAAVKATSYKLNYYGYDASN